MISRLNYTDRRKIARKDVRISAQSDDDHKFLIEVSSSVMDIIRDAACFVDITSSDNRQVVRVPMVVRGQAIDRGPYATEDIPCSRAIFDFKVVSTRPEAYGRILRRANGLRVSRGGKGDASGEVDLLLLASEDLGERFWDLRLGDPVTLVINQRLPLSPEQCASSPVFASLVFPEICRRALEWATVYEGRTSDDLDSGGTDAATLWYRFAVGLDDAAPEAPREGWTAENRAPLDDWINAVGDAMARQHEFLKALTDKTLDVFR